MSDLLNEAVKQVPNLAVLAFIVFVFVKHLKGYNALLREINRENMDARAKSRTVIEENTKAVATNTEVLKGISVEIGYLKAHHKI